MKQRFFLILTIISSFMNLSIYWFLDVLWSNLWVMTLSIQMIYLLCLLVCLIASIIFVILRPKQRYFRVTLIISAITFLLLFYFPFRAVKTKVEFVLFKTDRNEIIRMAENNELKTDELSAGVLPKGYGHLSADGTFHLEKYDDGVILYLYILRTVGGAIELVYSSGGEELIYQSSDAAYITEIKPMGENWYYIVTE